MASFVPWRRSRLLSVLGVAGLRLWAPVGCGLVRHQNLPPLDEHYANNEGVPPSPLLRWESIRHQATLSSNAGQGNQAINKPPPTISKPDTGFFEEIEHTADLALRCGGPDLEALFRNAARGMYHLMGVETRDLNDATRQRIRLAAEDVESLLVDWLGELAYQAEAGGLVFKKIEFEILSATRLEAKLVGRPVRHVHTLIKAVTYHQLEVAKTNDGYTATVVFDV